MHRELVMAVSIEITRDLGNTRGRNEFGHDSHDGIDHSKAGAKSGTDEGISIGLQWYEPQRRERSAGAKGPQTDEGGDVRGTRAIGQCGPARARPRMHQRCFVGRRLAASELLN